MSKAPSIHSEKLAKCSALALNCSGNLFLCKDVKGYSRAQGGLDMAVVAVAG